MDNTSKLKKLAIAYLALIGTIIGLGLIIFIWSLIAFGASSNLAALVNPTDPKSLLTFSAGSIALSLIIYLLMVPIGIALIVILIWSAIIAPNQKYLVLFIVGHIFWIVGLVGMIMYLVEYKKMPKQDSMSPMMQ
ncbi:Hypothetical protein, predicted transmembrane protein [Metamycoplasma auris 15026]|uniref:Uncharacterized protein n=1 Tax=Metamycoplasma auris 15026 TaxID=1188233 RepID=N9VBP5_9BACT|nr:hypothetical protein [Metamycoplasma auris]ENY68831.1 Hypothetical protein, predicted transmembrane protein [Metamycoplasma auris 15026]